MVFCCSRAAALALVFVGLVPYIIHEAGGLEIPDSTGDPVSDTDGDTARRLKLLPLT